MSNTSAAVDRRRQLPLTPRDYAAASGFAALAFAGLFLKKLKVGGEALGVAGKGINRWGQAVPIGLASKNYISKATVYANRLRAGIFGGVAAIGAGIGA